MAENVTKIRPSWPKDVVPQKKYLGRVCISRGSGFANVIMNSKVLLVLYFAGESSKIVSAIE